MNVNTNHTSDAKPRGFADADKSDLRLCGEGTNADAINGRGIRNVTAMFKADDNKATSTTKSEPNDDAQPGSTECSEHQSELSRREKSNTYPIEDSEASLKCLSPTPWETGVASGCAREILDLNLAQLYQLSRRSRRSQINGSTVDYWCDASDFSPPAMVPPSPSHFLSSPSMSDMNLIDVEANDISSNADEDEETLPDFDILSPMISTPPVVRSSVVPVENGEVVAHEVVSQNGVLAVSASELFGEEDTEQEQKLKRRKTSDDEAEGYSFNVVCE